MDRETLYGLGLWRDWLKSIEIGEEVTVGDMDPEVLPLVRTAASKLKKDGYFYRVTTQEGQVTVKRYTEGDWKETARAVQDFGQDPFEVGAWKEWLRGFTVGEWEIRPYDGPNWRSIRATMTLLKKEEGLLFTARAVRTPEGTRVVVMRKKEEDKVDLSKWK